MMDTEVGREGSVEPARSSSERPAKRRRVFLQTMGQQLRDVGQTTDSRSLSLGGDSTTAISHNEDTPHSERVNGRQVHIQTPESDIVPGEDEGTSHDVTSTASKPLWRPGEVRVVLLPDVQNTSTFNDMISWSRSYFDNWHPAFPFLHAPTVLDYFRQTVDLETPLQLPTHQLTILRSIMSIALADRRQTGLALGSIPQEIVFTSLNDAINSAQCLLIEESTILGLQAVVSVQLFLISMLRYNAASRLEGLSTRMAFHLGLHRCPKQSPDLSTIDVEIRQRLFWSMYAIDRYICIRLGIPLGIRDTEVTTCFPGKERHGTVVHEQANDGRLDLLRFLSEHARVRGRITELRNKSVVDRSTSSDEAIAISADLQKWWNSVDEYLDVDSTSGNAIGPFHKIILIVLRHEATIALYKHILATSQNNAAYNSALQNCVTAARSIISTLHNTKFESPSQDRNTTDNPTQAVALLWPSFTWAIWMSTFLIIYAANEEQISYDAAIRLADKALEILQHLTLRASVWPRACTAAIRNLRGQLIKRRNNSKHTTRTGKHGISDNIEVRSGQYNSDTHGHSQGNAQGSFNKQQSDTITGGRPSMLGSQSALRIGDNSTINDEPPENGVHTNESFTTTPPPPFVNRLNWMLSENVPFFGDLDSNDYSARINGVDFGFQMPTGTGSQIIDGWETQFWM